VIKMMFGLVINQKVFNSKHRPADGGFIQIYNFLVNVYIGAKGVFF